MAVAECDKLLRKSQCVSTLKHQKTLARFMCSSHDLVSESVTLRLALIRLMAESHKHARARLRVRVCEIAHAIRRKQRESNPF